MPRRHEIPSTPESMVWGYLDSSTPPILEVSSGDTVTLHSFPAGGKETLPDDLSLVAADYMKALETLPPGPGPHFITGPVFVKGAHVGDVLFNGSVGRTDLPGGSHATLIESIKEKLLPLGDDVGFICGHGAGSSIGQERMTNPFITGGL